MSTDLVALQNQLPAEIRAQLAQQLSKDLERLGAIGGKDTIRVTQDKKFELPNGDTLDEIEVAVVDFVYRNEYYLGAFNRKQLSPPACFSIAQAASTMQPSNNSPIRQSDACATCQQNQWGSSPTGDGKACKNTVMLAVLPLDATDDTPIWVIKSSPTAVKHFNAYVAKLARGAGVPVSAVATKLFFDPNSTFASLRFDAIGPNPVFELTNERKAEAAHRLGQEPDVSAFEMPGSGKK